MRSKDLGKLTAGLGAALMASSLIEPGMSKARRQEEDRRLLADDVRETLTNRNLGEGSLFITPKKADPNKKAKRKAQKKARMITRKRK